MPELRAQAPEPTAYLSPSTAKAQQLERGHWIHVATSHGQVVMRVEVRQQMPDGLVRVPHGWWVPESARGGDHLSGVWTFGDAQLTGDDDPELMDIEHGIPHLRGAPCRVSKLTADELKSLEATYGPTSVLPRGPKPEIARSDRSAPEDFMYDPDIGDGVEFAALELATYGKGSLN